MKQPKQFNPIPWAVSVGIIVLCVAAAISIANSCQPAKFEFFQLLKTELGGCSRNEVMPKVALPSLNEIEGVTSIKDNVSSTSLNVESMNRGVSEPIENKPQENFSPVDIREIQVGEKYHVTNLINPDLFNAPIHKDKPKWGRVAPVIGNLSPNKDFVVKDIISTFSGYKWIKIRIESSSPDKIKEGWLPWGEKETPIIKSEV